MGGLWRDAGGGAGEGTNVSGGPDGRGLLGRRLIGETCTGEFFDRK